MESISFNCLPYLQAATALTSLAFVDCPVVIDAYDILMTLQSRQEVESLSFSQCLGVMHLEKALREKPQTMSISACDMVVSAHLLPNEVERKAAMEKFSIGSSEVVRQVLAATVPLSSAVDQNDEEEDEEDPDIRTIYSTERDRDLVAIGINLIREEKEILKNSCETDWKHMAFRFANQQSRYESNERWLCPGSCFYADTHWGKIRFGAVEQLPGDVDTDPRPMVGVEAVYSGYDSTDDESENVSFHLPGQGGWHREKKKIKIKMKRIKVYTKSLVRPRILPIHEDLEVYRLNGLCLGQTTFDMTHGHGYESCVCKRNYIFHFDRRTRRWYCKYAGYFVNRCSKCERRKELFIKFNERFLCSRCLKSRYD
jgi:hypothetical protein